MREKLRAMDVEKLDTYDIPVVYVLTTNEINTQSDLLRDKNTRLYCNDSLKFQDFFGGTGK